MEAVVAARSAIACLTLLIMAAPARAAFIDLDPHEDEVLLTGDGSAAPAIPGAAAFNQLSKPMPISIAFGSVQGMEETSFTSGAQPSTWPPGALQQAENPVILPDVPRSAGWMPLVGGLALVAYRMRRNDRRFRFRSAV